MRSAADIEEVGCPEPAAVLHRMESTRSCCPNWRANSRSVVASASVVTVISLPTTLEWHVPRRNFAGPPACIRLYVYRSVEIGSENTPWVQGVVATPLN